MTSWRDSASQEAQDDIDGLLNASLPFAQEMLDKHGEFFPYGMSLALDGEVTMVAGDTGVVRPLSTDVLATLVDGFRRQRPELRAVALVSDVRHGDGEAVRVEIEHLDGHCLAAFLSYRRKRLRRGIEYGGLTAGPSRPQIWTG